MIQFDGPGVTHDPTTGEYAIILPDYANDDGHGASEEECRLALAGILSDLLDARRGFGLNVTYAGRSLWMAEVIQHG